MGNCREKRIITAPNSMAINKLAIFDTKPADSTIEVVLYTKIINGVLEDKPYKVKVKKLGVTTL